MTSRTWPIAPVVWADPLERAARHLVEADLLYVRDPVRLADCDDAQLGRLALIADKSCTAVPDWRCGACWR